VRFNAYLFLEPCTAGRLNFNLSALTIPFGLRFPNGLGRISWKRTAELVDATLLTTRSGIEHQNFHRSVRPLPIADFGKIVSMFANVLFVLHEPVAQQLLEMRIHLLKPRHSVHNIAGQMKAVELV
jgi:hypothetical protein